MRAIYVLGSMGLLLLTACATPAASGDLAWADGWRKATVSSVRDELRWYQRSSCGRQANPGEKFVVLRYRTVGKSRLAIVPVAPNKAPEAGLPVRFNVKSCDWVNAPDEH